MSHLSNTAYIFIPMCYEGKKSFIEMIDKIKSHYMWESLDDKITYMLKYITDKINGNDKENCKYFHFRMSEEARGAVGLGSFQDWYSTKEHEYCGEKERYRFQIESVQFFCFRTALCMMAFQIRFEKSDPFWLASAEYHLKKVSREEISVEGEHNRKYQNDTFLTITKRIIGKLNLPFEMDYFFYANPGTERANMLTYLEVKDASDYKKELFYLRNCYSDGFHYVEDFEVDKKQSHSPSNDTFWGISPEAAVCIVCPERGRENFLRNTFYKNFNTQYLFMYVFLLHQKYGMYSFLTKMGIGKEKNLDKLEEYREELYEFQSDYVFSCVTEVPQYQKLYEKMIDAFALKTLYEDVREPLDSLDEIRRVMDEDRQKRRDGNVNSALLKLSLLSFFSALIDSFDFADSFLGWFFTDNIIQMIQIVLIICIVIVAVFVVRSLIEKD